MGLQSSSKQLGPADDCTLHYWQMVLDKGWIADWYRPITQTYLFLCIYTEKHEHLRVHLHQHLHMPIIINIYLYIRI